MNEFMILPFDVVNTSLQLCKETGCHVLLFLSEVSLRFHEISTVLVFCSSSCQGSETPEGTIGQRH